MESLQLPQDLYWDVKMEPNSPSSELIPFINTEDSWLFEDNFAKDIFSQSTKNEIDIISNASSPYTEGELLYEFEFDSKTGQFIDGKPNINQLDYTENLIPPQPCPSQAIKVQNSLEIFMELEKIYNVTELTQLTPPQTPPQEVNEVKEIFDLITAQQNITNCSSSIFCPSLTNDQNNDNDVIDIIPALSPSNSDYSSNIENSPLPSASDIAREMQIVDEILRTRAKELPDWTDNEQDEDENDDDHDHDQLHHNKNNGSGIDVDYDDGESLHSSSSSSSSSTTSDVSFVSPSSSSLSLSPSSSNDDEWIPSTDKNSSIVGKISNGKSQKRRTRPYGRPIEDKKIRKKEQNKNAATRYRQKKKQEMEEILEVERELAKRNEDLQKQVTDIEREIKYLKQLIKEFHKSKNSK